MRKTTTSRKQRKEQDILAYNISLALSKFTAIMVGKPDEYKTTKLVMRKCPAGTDPLNQFSLTKDFFAGVFEVTQKQWKLVMILVAIVLKKKN